ncbi:MAG: PAS domain-containing protein [Deltaproteobacteria bacterium]|jgi:PAS domain S-box-containing protein|nr:PAS domain-containing protein [Deltaproteobacteria bacterium]
MQPKGTNMMLPGSERSLDYRPEPRKKAFWIGLGIIAVVSIAALIWVAYGLSAREKNFEANLKKRLELIAASQVQLFEALIERSVEQANRVINSELFKLYASEIHLVENDVSRIVAGVLPGEEPLDEGLAQLSAQLPMMQNLLVEFTRISGYLSGRVVNRNGTVYLATDSLSTPLRSDQVAIIKSVLEQQESKFGPLQHTEQGLVVEAYLPIFPPEGSGLDRAPVAVLVLAKIVHDRLSAISASDLMEKGERVRMVQKVGQSYQEVVPWLPGQLKTIKSPLPLGSEERLPFAVRPALAGEATVYSIGVPISGPDWWIVIEADYGIAREELRGQQKALTSIAILLILFFGVTFGAVWAVFIGGQERKLAKHFEHLAQEIDKQRQLLDQINNNIEDYIVLYDLQGRFQYVNPAFAKAVDRDPEELIGLDNEAVFGYDSAKRLEYSDQQVLTTQESYIFNEKVYLKSRLHHLQICKAPLKDNHGKVTGIVSVIRDVTELIEVQRLQEQATHKTVEALVRAIEQTDPYLAGHSRLMGVLGVEVAKALNASDVEIATIETAANLCQIGKLFVDRKLLFKAEPLTAEEKKHMEGHIEHAAKVLEGIDFGLPIYEAITQMNETPDGRGYPKGLEGDDIVFTARVLSVVNSFCAMVQPRVYRGARSVSETLSVIEDSIGSYDPRVVDALKEVVHSALGEKLLARYQNNP